jgi:hypothetical protein
VHAPAPTPLAAIVGLGNVPVRLPPAALYGMPLNVSAVALWPVAIILPDTVIVLFSAMLIGLVNVWAL